MKEKIKKIGAILSKEELGILPASLTYYFVLAIIPIITITVLIASSFNISIDKVVTLINDILPYKASSFIIEIISGKGFDSNVGIFNLIAFIGATKGTYAIIKTANNLYKVKETDIIKDRIKSGLLLINILLLLIFLILVPAFGESILNTIQKSSYFSGLTNELVFIINLIKWPFTFFVIYFNIKFIYTLAPSKIVLSKHTTLGALITTILWLVSSVIFGYYLQYFANYDILYGNLSSIIILMIWLYVISYVFVLGMIINTNYYKNLYINREEK